MTCRTCKFLDVAPNVAGKRVARKWSVYRCLAPVPRTAFLLPASITSGYGYREPTERDRKHMQPDDGADCPLYEKRS